MALAYKNYERPSSFKQPPWFLKRVQSALDEAVLNPKLGFLKSLNLVNKNNPGRQKRSERRVGVREVCKIMWDGVDIETGVWGKPNLKKQYKQDFYIKGLDELSESSGRPQQNIKRIMGDLFRAGYITQSARNGVDHSGNTVRYFSLRRFTTKFLAEIGIKPWELEAAKHRKRKNKEKEPAPYSENPVTMMMRVNNGHPNSPSKIHAKNQLRLAKTKSGEIKAGNIIAANPALDSSQRVTARASALSNYQSNLLKFSNGQMLNLVGTGITPSEFREFFTKINEEIRAGISLDTKHQEISSYCTATLRRQRIN